MRYTPRNVSMGANPCRGRFFSSANFRDFENLCPLCSPTGTTVEPTPSWMTGPPGEPTKVAEPVACTEAEWVRTLGEVVGWRGEVVAVPAGRIPLPYQIEQALDTDSGRIRRELGFVEVVTLGVALSGRSPGSGPIRQDRHRGSGSWITPPRTPCWPRSESVEARRKGRLR